MMIVRVVYSFFLSNFLIHGAQRSWIVEDLPHSWKQFDNHNILDDLAKIERKAILISGGVHRFIFQNSRIQKIEPRTDVFIELHNDSNSPTFKGRVGIIPYEVSKLTIEKYYKELGAESVHISVYDPNDVKSMITNMEVAIGLEVNATIDDKSRWKRWIPHSMMFLLRHLVFQTAIRYEKWNNFTYSNFLYQREDNVYVTPEPIILPKHSNLTTYCNTSMQDACVVVDKYCGWGSYSDKIYYTNHAGAEILFSRTWRDFINFLGPWIR